MRDAPNGPSHFSARITPSNDFLLTFIESRCYDVSLFPSIPFHVLLQVLGIKNDSLLNRPWLSLSHPSDEPILRELLSHLLSEDSPTQVPYLL